MCASIAKGHRGSARGKTSTESHIEKAIEGCSAELVGTGTSDFRTVIALISILKASVLLIPLKANNAKVDLGRLAGW
jgi:hypothetical protein